MQDFYKGAKNSNTSTLVNLYEAPSPGTHPAEDGRKMSKSLGNVINPNELIETYGADTLAFMKCS